MAATDPKAWGPAAWRTIHAFALQADKQGRQGYETFKNFLGNTSHMLPCEACQKHMNDYIFRMRTQYGAQSMFEYTVHFHNDVNKRLGKPIMSLEQARSLWSQPDGPQVECGSCSAGADGGPAWPLAAAGPVGTPVVPPLKLEPEFEPRSGVDTMVMGLLLLVLVGSLYVTFKYMENGNRDGGFWSVWTSLWSSFGSFVRST